MTTTKSRVVPFAVFAVMTVTASVIVTGRTVSIYQTKAIAAEALRDAYRTSLNQLRDSVAKGLVTSSPIKALLHAADSTIAQSSDIRTVVWGLVAMRCEDMTTERLKRYGLFKYCGMARDVNQR